MLARAPFAQEAHVEAMLDLCSIANVAGSSRACNQNECFHVLYIGAWTQVCVHVGIDLQTTEALHITFDERYIARPVSLVFVLMDLPYPLAFDVDE
jgi:hypothetical protein